MDNNAEQTSTQKCVELAKEFLSNVEKAESGNKSAGQRARKNSLEFSKASVAFRKDSVASSK